MNQTVEKVELTRENPIGPGHGLASVTDKIADVILRRPVGLGWALGLLVALSLAGVLQLAIGYLLFKGTGIWGIRIPVGWGFAIVNFVWWIGIGHAGTLISAILCLLRQPWRNSINRFAEAMTIFAVMCAGLFPLLHTGRPWLAYWMFPIPNSMGVWPQFRSPLIWDVFAVSTYATISIVFWLVGMIPDLATMRDTAKNAVIKTIFGALAMGWTGSARHWKRYETAYLLLAGLSTPLVLSVHTVVSFDFAVGVVPGWHTTIFPPYFVAGAIYCGFAMVLVLAIPIRMAYGVTDFITEKHLDYAAKVMLGTGLIVGYGYLMEFFMAFYGGGQYDTFLVWNRLHGPYKLAYYALLLTNIVIPQILWVKKIRLQPFLLFLVSCVVLIGMWLERFVIVIVSLSRDFVPSAWGQFTPTIWDWATFAGTLGLFFTLMFLFVRVLPMINMAEMKMLVPEAEVHHV